ncbi:Uncharacterised protein [Mycobacteroides abscessus subsp. abscessus]|uniref:hypothetical protein n=1 Tax=Mycobacteroides abscessus TaxID=36809 RepID=UPI00092B0A32|nr:hypothetical protein [Mycobacteroides abscessus]SHX66326.1 Uncharacterised protein [Mycobacteroides abscessus subsp. abscessus]SIC60324.1 Uncharacterised protein [Mycobacteroides abscessus subsp. abscessus]SKK21081.1 Uncharacterised protein [Mycobacteroides abscessus subsp. abscessus]SKP50500.1 Uncharacterised protein [Mycobacteroides abscessus subsp. abscessus]
MSSVILDRRRETALYLCDLGLPSVVIRYGVAYASARAFADTCGLPASVEDLLTTELRRDPDARAAAERITPAAQERIRGLVDEWWVPLTPTPKVATLLPIGLTAKHVGQAAREVAALRGGWSASVLYIGAVAEAEHRGVNVASLIVGDPALVTARREIVAAAERSGITCADLADWLMDPVIWSEVIERAGVLAAVERIGVESGLELAS